MLLPPPLLNMTQRSAGASRITSAREAEGRPTGPRPLELFIIIRMLLLLLLLLLPLLLLLLPTATYYYPTAYGVLRSLRSLRYARLRSLSTTATYYDLLLLLLWYPVWMPQYRGTTGPLYVMALWCARVT